MVFIISFSQNLFKVYLFGQIVRTPLFGLIFLGPIFPLPICPLPICPLLIFSLPICPGPICLGAHLSWCPFIRKPNSICSHIQFTIKKEHNFALPFLDVLVKYNSRNGSITSTHSLFSYHNLQKNNAHQQIYSLHVTSPLTSKAHCYQNSAQQG